MKPALSERYQELVQRGETPEDAAYLMDLEMVEAQRRRKARLQAQREARESAPVAA
jgi:hypothetical protein